MARVALTDDNGALYGAPATWIGTNYATKQEASQRGNTFVLVGDSRVDVETTDTADFTDFTRSGPFTWANAILGQRLDVLHEAGVSGQNLAQVGDRYETDVLAHSPANIWLSCGVNSVTQNVSAADMKTQFTTLFDMGKGAGARTFVATINPKDDHTTAQRAVLAEVNRWLLTLHRDDVTVVDITTPSVSATEMKWRTGYSMSNDSVPLHANQAGGCAQGKALANVLGTVFPPRNILPIMAGDPSNLITNPFFTGTGTVATGVESYTPQGGTLSLVPCTDGVPGNWQQFTAATASNLTYNWYWATLAAAGLNVGDKLSVAMEFETENLTGGSPNFVLYTKAGAGYTKTVRPFRSAPGDTAGYPYADAPTRLTLRTPDFEIPAGTDNLHFQVSIPGVIGTIRIRRAVIRKVS